MTIDEQAIKEFNESLNKVCEQFPADPTKWSIEDLKAMLAIDPSSWEVKIAELTKRLDKAETERDNAIHMHDRVIGNMRHALGIGDGTATVLEAGRIRRERDEAIARAERAVRSESELRTEIEQAFRKHGMAAGPRALDAIIEQRDAAIRERDEIKKMVQQMRRDRGHALVEKGDANDRIVKLETTINEAVEHIRRLIHIGQPSITDYNIMNEAASFNARIIIKRKKIDPVCRICNDTHVMHFDDSSVMCTHCPTPCQKCRKGGNGPYCEKTPCDCECHKKVSGK